MAKQDMVAPRTATDIERKYNMKQTFAEFAGLVGDAQKAAQVAEEAAKNASSAVNNLDSKLDQEEIFNRLTNNGEAQGIYRENGKIYINASYLVSGIIDATLVTIKNLIAEKLTSILDEKSLKVDGAKLQLLTDSIWNVELSNKFAGMPIFYMRNTENGEATDLTELSPTHLKLGGTSTMPVIYFSAAFGEPKMWLNGESDGKTLSWKDNGDGTFTLIGT